MRKNKQSGQALITLLFFTIIAIMIAAVSISVISGGSLATGSIEQEESAYYIAESGAENAVLRLLRDPNYTGETLTIDGGSAQVVIAGNNPYIISSTGILGNIRRTIQVDVSYNNNVLSINSWNTIQ